MKPAPVQLTDAEYAQKLLFPYAEQPDIIRASQKDDYYRHVLNSNTFDVLRQAAGPRAMKFKEELQLLSDGIYYGLSTLLGMSFFLSVD